MAVSNLAAAQAWYVEKLGLRVAPAKANDSDLPCLWLHFCEDGEVLTLTQKAAQPRAPLGIDRVAPPLLFTAKLEKAREWLTARGVVADPIQKDSSETEFFRFQDLEGNKLEVCKET